MTSLRPATVLDIELLASLHTISWQHSYRTMLPDSYLDNEIGQERLEYWQNKIKAEGRITMIAQDNQGQAMGFISGEMDGRALLDNIHLLPQYQGGGAGQMMMRCFKTWAQERGATQMYLFVLEQNDKAIRFYERNGWQLKRCFKTQLVGIDVSSREYVYQL
ncbi:acyl-CoA N-acyltransferase [Chlamydoabsidia padenii]|nr:acyl-CoA N-acyltransferase [Chlamydoabsidia padenii]